jgi:hypothetical protein
MRSHSVFCLLIYFVYDYKVFPEIRDMGRGRGMAVYRDIGT